MEKREVARHKVMRDTRRFVQDIDLPAEHVFGFFEDVCGGARRTGDDFVEAGCYGGGGGGGCGGGVYAVGEVIMGVSG